MAEHRDRRIIAVGGGLLALYLLQALLGWEWRWLAELQGGESYKRWSGVMLLGYLFHQWWLSLGRSRGWARVAKRSYWLHKWLGAASPVFFYIHSMKLGYGFLFLLSTVYLGNIVVGLAHRAMSQPARRRLGTPWMITHVAASVLLTVLALYHAWVVLWYE